MSLSLCTKKKCVLWLDSFSFLSVSLLCCFQVGFLCFSQFFFLIFNVHFDVFTLISSDSLNNQQQGAESVLEKDLTGIFNILVW